METPHWGFFALVSYVPGPLGPYLDRLRQTFSSEAHPQAHITILPPRPLRVPVSIAADYARGVLRNSVAFDVELSAVRRFPETNVLYLDLTDGNAQVYRLHADLNTADLADTEQFEFRPHLTIAGPVPEGAVDTVQNRAIDAWESFDQPKRFHLDEIVALWAEPHGDSARWKRLCAFSLQRAASCAASAGLIGRTS